MAMLSHMVRPAQVAGFIAVCVAILGVPSSARGEFVWNYASTPHQWQGAWNEPSPWSNLSYRHDRYQSSFRDTPVVPPDRLLPSRFSDPAVWQAVRDAIDAGLAGGSDHFNYDAFPAALGRDHGHHWHELFEGEWHDFPFDRYWGGEGSIPGDENGVPEPMTLAMMSLGAVVVLARRRTSRA